MYFRCALHESWRTHMEVLAMASSSYQLSGARGKASQLLRQCLLVYSVSTSSHKALQDFMKRLNLFLYSPPSTAPLASDQVLALHVELSYSYGVSGLLRIRPSLARSLSVELDGVALAASLKRERDILYPLILATIAGAQLDPGLVTLMESLFESMEQAVATAAIHISAQAASPLLKQVKDLKFAGVSANAFADAIEAKTVYRRDASVFESSRLMTVLESVWQEFSSSVDLFLWTSWYVLDELAPFVETAVAQMRSQMAFQLACVEMVSHSMAPALAALIRMSQVTSKSRDQITTMTHVLASCLKKKYLVPSSVLPAGCQASASGSQDDWVLQNLLAYSCIGDALSALNGSYQRRLPQLAGLKPETIMHTVGCLKDCIAQPSGPGRCIVSSQRLKAFEDAFSCSLKGQQGLSCTL